MYGKNIKDLRIDHDETQEQLATLIGVTGTLIRAHGRSLLCINFKLYFFCIIRTEMISSYPP